MMLLKINQLSELADPLKVCIYCCYSVVCAFLSFSVTSTAQLLNIALKEFLIKGKHNCIKIGCKAWREPDIHH